MGIDRLEAILRARAPSGLTWMCRPYANGTHLTTWIKGFWDGVKYCYRRYYTAGIGFKPMNGTVLKETPVNLRLDVCPRDSEFANAATPANIGTTVTTFMSILSPKSTVC